MLNLGELEPGALVARHSLPHEQLGVVARWAESAPLGGR
jgi:hypothetical protein